MDTERLVELVRRAPVLAALQEAGAMDRRELETHLDVSKSTVHRLTRSLRERGLVEREAGAFVLTPLGTVCATEVTAFATTIDSATALAPMVATADAHDVAFDVGAFADATVTTAAPGNPYRPVERFMALVSRTDELRGLDPATINPLHVDALYERIVDGMATEVVFPPAVVEELLETNPDRAEHVIESGNLTMLVNDDLPFGLTLCDERVGVGIYDDDTGLLRTYADTDAPAAREWAEDVYASYRADAISLDDHPSLSRLSPGAAPGEHE
ncbi:helix-turn-helix transcriptional regulator [Halococcus sediminicola]|uniref:helix-turn-helix transcriptional regulator n=1 Tax=Halococcus sediminicola TaxID=1264579 RepID=UPI0006784982|nr:MarR family transcriptional regulator [Halococcus sediminicola]